MAINPFNGLLSGKKTTNTPSVTNQNPFSGLLSTNTPASGSVFSERLQSTVPTKFLNPEYQDTKKPVVKLLNYQELQSLAPEEKEQYKNLLKQDIADAIPSSTIATKNNIINTVLNKKYSFNPFSSPFMNRTQQDITQDVVKEVLNTPVGKEAQLSIIENTENIPIKILSRLGSVKGLELRTDTNTGDTYKEILNKWVDAGTNPEAPTWKKFLYQTQSSLGQTGLGVMLNLSGNALVPGAGTALSSAYWAALSGGEQIQRRGKVYSLTDIGIDVALDSWLGNNIEGIFKKGSKDFILKTMAKSGFGEGGTEVAQSLLKYMNDYISAPTPEAKQEIVKQAKNYVTSGDMFMEFASAFASGAILAGGGQKASPIQNVQTGSVGDQNQGVIPPTIPPTNPPTAPAMAQETIKTQEPIQSWSELQKTNPELFNTGILRKSQAPYNAKGVIPESVHSAQGKWQNYGQDSEIQAETIYGKPDNYGYYNDKNGNPITDTVTGEYIKDTNDYDNNGERVMATISNEQLKKNLIESFSTPEGKKYLSEVIEALPKNSDGSVTAYRIGSIGGDGPQSYTLSEGMAKTFSNQGTDIMPAGLPGLPKGGYKDFGVLPTNIVKIDPKGIVAWSPYDAEILVEPKYVKKMKAQEKPVKETKPTDLIQEAKKYKSAEEFVKGQGEQLLHGTTQSFENFDLSKAGSRNPADQGFAGRGIYFSNSKEVAETFASGKDIYKTVGKEGKANIIEARLNPNARILEVKGFKEMYDKLGLKGITGTPEFLQLNREDRIIAKSNLSKNVSDTAQKMGYDAIKVNDGIDVDKYGTQTFEIVVFNPDIIKTKSQLTDIWDKAQGETKPSKIAKSIEAKAIENKLTKGFGEVAGYTPITLKDQAERASSLVNDDIETVKKIVRGEQELPAGLKGTALVTAVEEYIKTNKDSQLAYELANSNLITATSEAGQELRLAAEREQDSATAKLLEVRKYREQKAEKATKKTVKDVTKQIKKQSEKVNLSKAELSWGNFIDQIKC